MPKQDVVLNFAPLGVDDFQFTLFVRDRQTNEANPDKEHLRSYAVLAHDAEERRDVWARLNEQEGFAPIQISARRNRYAAHWWLAHALHNHLITSTTGLKLDWHPNGFGNYFDVGTQQHAEGWEAIRIEPYYLSSQHAFGLRLHFHFVCNAEQPFNRRVQQLSLSLDSNGRSNRNFYRDRYARIESFLNEVLLLRMPLAARGASPIDLSRTFASVEHSLLRPKQYEFAGAHSGPSQYQGVRQHGPYSGVDVPPLFVFMFRESDRQLARHLYQSLLGKVYPAQFPGMQAFFGVQFGPENVEHHVLSDLSPATFQAAADALHSAEHPNPIPILVMDGEESSYYAQKAAFIRHNIATQDVTTETLRDDKKLKWGIAGIGLQIFCKAGGTPWRVQVPDADCLIVGLSRVEIPVENGRTRYFAYSVLTDAAGDYRDIHVVGDSMVHGDYLDQVEQRMIEVLTNEATGFSRVVVHATYSLKQDEMIRLDAAVKSLQGQAASPAVAVIRLNGDNQHFGFAVTHASMVPFESTVVRLGFREYLVWFEGAQFHRPHVSERKAGPTHVKILYTSEGFTADDGYFLQGLLNLSGANWRGFNAKSAPVSTYYCRLVGRFLGEFSERELGVPPIRQLHPWFL